MAIITEFRCSHGNTDDCPECRKIGEFIAKLPPIQIDNPDPLERIATAAERIADALEVANAADPVQAIRSAIEAEATQAPEGISYVKQCLHCGTWIREEQTRCPACNQRTDIPAPPSWAMT